VLTARLAAAQAAYAKEHSGAEAGRTK
jgi:hypothetical protein